jgi:hypothetical protein
MRCSVWRAVGNAAVLPTFMEPYEADDDSIVTRTGKDADAALKFLVEQNMVLVDGDDLDSPAVCRHVRCLVGRGVSSLGYQFV